MPLEFTDTASEYVTVADNSLLDVGALDFCVMCWFDVSAAGDEFISKGRFSFDFPGWQIRYNAPGDHILGVIGDGGGAFDILASAGGFLIPPRTWHHVAMVRDNTASLYRLYIDGVEVDSLTPLNATGSLDSPEDFLIGAINEPAGTPSHFMDGPIDDVRQYNRLVTANEIATIYAARGHDGIVDSLVVRYMMNEGPPGPASGAGSVKDSGPNGLNGTPTNTPNYNGGILSFRKMVQ